MRFNFHADTAEEARQYLCNRALQMAHTGARLKEITENEFGLWAEFTYRTRPYFAFYLYKRFRGQDKYMQEWDKLCQRLGERVPIITTMKCQLVDYLVKKNIPFELCDGLLRSEEYEMIEKFYGDIKAKRSGVYKMNHIDEGLYILYRIKAKPYASSAYILHPIFQADEDLSANYPLSYEINGCVITLVMEYRRVANNYLSKREIKSIGEIELSPLREVNDMLVADKIQNFKDFMQYHFEKHERSDALALYFKNWFERLGITPATYIDIKQELNRIAQMPIQKLQDTSSQTS